MAVWIFSIQINFLFFYWTYWCFELLMLTWFFVFFTTFLLTNMMSWYPLKPWSFHSLICLYFLCSLRCCSLQMVRKSSQLDGGGVCGCEEWLWCVVWLWEVNMIVCVLCCCEEWVWCVVWWCVREGYVWCGVWCLGVAVRSKCGVWCGCEEWLWCVCAVWLWIMNVVCVRSNCVVVWLWMWCGVVCLGRVCLVVWCAVKCFLDVRENILFLWVPYCVVQRVPKMSHSLEIEGPFYALTISITLVCFLQVLEVSYKPGPSLAPWPYESFLILWH